MPTEIEKAFQVALEVANEPKPTLERESPRPQSPDDEREDASTSVTPPLPAVDFASALTLVHSIAQGRDPYTTDDASRHLPEHNPATVKALCVVATYLSQLHGIENRALNTGSTSDSRGSMPLEEFLARIERREILLALEACRYNKTEAARTLGLTFRALRYKLEQHRID